MTPGEVVAQMTAAWNAGDKTAYLACAAPNVRQDDGQATARSEWEDDWDKVHEAFPDCQNDIARMVSSGEHCATEVVFTGTNTGPVRFFGGDVVPPTGKRVRFVYAAFAQVRNDLIVSENTYGILSRLKEELGVAPASL